MSGGCLLGAALRLVAFFVELLVSESLVALAACLAGGVLQLEPSWEPLRLKGLKSLFVSDCKRE